MLTQRGIQNELTRKQNVYMEVTMISILKLAFQLTKIVIVGFYLENDKLIIKVRPHAKRQARCPKCGKVCRVYNIAKNPKR